MTLSTIVATPALLHEDACPARLDRTARVHCQVPPLFGRMVGWTARLTSYIGKTIPDYSQIF